MIDKQELDQLNEDIKTKGYVDREHLLKFLTLIPSNDAPTIIREVNRWLKALHDDPSYETVRFPKGDINSILGDLDSYGRVQTSTIQQFKQSSNKVVPQTT